MAKNKKTHHRPGPGKPRGATYAQVLAHKAAVRKGLEQAARDATVQVQADTHTQRAMWLMVCSIADAYGFGPKQLQKFFTALQDNTDELERMRTDVDEEYAFEKLRQKAQAVTGMEVHYLYEQEALLAEMQAAKEGVSAHEYADNPNHTQRRMDAAAKTAGGVRPGAYVVGRLWAGDDSLGHRIQHIDHRDVHERIF